MNEPTEEPDWDTPLSLNVTPQGLIQALFWSANAVHTGWSSCLDPALTLDELKTVDEATGNWCRLIEQELLEETPEDSAWHDWTVELRIGDIYVTGHWQIPVNATPMEWEWHARAAEQAYGRACVLFGRRARKAVAVEDPVAPQVPPSDVRRH